MSNIKDRQWFRTTIFSLTQPFIPPAGILPTIVHEAAHWLTAFLLGVPISEIKFGFHGINPGVTIPTSTPPEVLPYFFFSGGFVSGTTLLMIYVFYWIKQYRRHPSSGNWIMSMCVVFSIAIQFYLGILEGRYYQAYPAHINSFQLLMYIIIAFACHVVIFYLMNRFREKRA